MTETTAQLTGLEKASVLLMSLGAEASQAILDQLSPEERNILGAQIVRMRSVKSVTKQKVFDEVTQAVKAGKPSSSEPLRWLEDYGSSQIARMLSGERPHNIAIVLSRLSPNTAADVLRHFGDATRNAVAIRLASMGVVSDEALSVVDATMRRYASDPQSIPKPRTAQPILKTLSNATANARDSVLSVISRNHAPAEVSVMPDFETLDDLVTLPDGRVQDLLGEVDIDDLCLVLRVASEQLRSVVLRNVPRSTAELLNERSAASAQIKIREIEIAQQRILGTFRRLARKASIGISMAEAVVE